jgi:hypothetical protein
MTKEFRPNLNEETPYLESPETPMLGEKGGVYVLSFVFLYVSMVELSYRM